MDRKPDPVGPLVLETFTLTVLAAWRWRIELALLAILATTYMLAGPFVAAALLVVALAAPQSRRALLNLLRAQRVKRQWTQAVIDSGAADPPPKRSRRKHSLTGPRAVRVRQVKTGDLLTVKIGRGNSVRDLEERREQLASCLSGRFHPVRDVRITPDRAHANRATALLIRRDAFENKAPIPWPLLTAEQVSLWDPIPFAVDEEGEEVSIDLVYRSLLLGGQPDSGKSVALQLIVAAAALDPDARLWLLDGKAIELAAWAPCAEALVGSNGKDAIRVLQTVDGIMEERYREIHATGARKIRRDDNLPLHLVVVDEIATYTQLPDPKEAAEFNRLLRRLVEKGRAAGIILIAATQKPHGETMDTNVRDLISLRFALSCNTPQASDTILGQGWSSQGWNAQRISLDTPGVGYLRAKGDPRKVRAYFLSDEDLQAISSRAAGNRIQEDPESPLLPHTPSTPKAKAAELRTASTKGALLNVLPAVGEGMSRGEIREATGLADQQTWPVLKALLADGVVVRAGGGKRDDPFRYRAVRSPVAQDVRTTTDSPGTGADSA